MFKNLQPVGVVYSDVCLANFYSGVFAVVLQFKKIKHMMWTFMPCSFIRINQQRPHRYQIYVVGSSSPSSIL